MSRTVDRFVSIWYIHEKHSIFHITKIINGIDKIGSGTNFCQGSKGDVRSISLNVDMIRVRRHCTEIQEKDIPSWLADHLMMEEMK